MGSLSRHSSLEMFDDPQLLTIGNAVGKAIKVDSTLIYTVRGRFTRVCVELNLNTPPHPECCGMGKKYSVEYGGLYRICFKCRKHGHKMEACGSESNQNVERMARNTDGATCSSAA